MRDSSGEKRQAVGVKSVFILIAINAVFYFFLQNPSFNSEMCLSYFGISQFKLWQLVSYMFLHANFMHIFMNMWGLYLFGTIIAPKMGAGRFLSMYFLCGIVGGLVWTALNWQTGAYLLGASGAVFGVLMATAMLYPDQKFLLLFFPVPIKTKTLVVIYAILEVLSNAKIDQVAHIVHLAGLVTAYIFIKVLYKDQAWDPLGFLFSPKKRGAGSAKAPKGWEVHKPKPETYRNPGNDGTTDASGEAMVTQRELDKILDKISNSTVNSLSQEEHDTLKRAREQMKNRR